MTQVQAAQKSVPAIRMPSHPLELEIGHDVVKAAVVVFAELGSSHGELARVVNALTLVREFKEAGDDVKLIFDGGGVATLAAMVRPEHSLNRLYQLIEDNVVGACAYCSKAFGVKEQLEEAGVSLLSDYKQHPSLRSLVVDGYQIFII